ncbi:acyl-CoA synthetase [Modestobacter sp. I12A-02628]|uniref:Acyl-CoA synthetase n=1 Tax=Goekera deserti TaxID=2497753 RepID=A0A7K3WFH1_9ACTN|nr:acyl-CoA synthetase [Goekera deserti]MPR00026.1 acyl-CoA synthetase [Goekera deserti]NDI49805.1 acyl-CoA synthetase [Goekera deserti]NEL55167.1 acyl-CoA synthetase [Goekera deserti]
MTDVAVTELVWAECSGPEDLTRIEQVPLEERGLPGTSYEALARAARLWPDRTAVAVLPDAEQYETPATRTFAQLLADVHRAANLLHALGVRRDDAVALLSPNCAELLPALLAAQTAGIVQPVNPALAETHVAELVRRSGARVLVTSSPALDPTAWSTAGALAEQGLLDTVLVLAPTGASVGDVPDDLHGVAVLGLADAAAAHDDGAFAGTPPTAESLASLFHTGGTTGTPKLAAHTHRNEISDAWMIATSSEFTEDSTGFAALPLFHVNALVVTLLAPLLRGQRVVWAGPLGYREPALYGCFWKIVERHRIAAMSAVPTVYAVLTACPVDADVSSLRFALVGASPLPDSVRAGFREHTGLDLVEGYGLTEATCATARSFPADLRAGSVGQRLPYQEVRAVTVAGDGSWQDLPAGETGRLVISGPTVFPGYVVGRDASGLQLDGLGALVDGWLDTGDLGSVDADGFIRLSGRAKDLIIRGGHNIDPSTVEDALLSHPAVTGAAAVGRPDVHAGEVPVAYVTLAPGAEADEQALREWAAGHVPEPAAAPRSVTVRPDLPVTDVGKPYKLPLRAHAAGQALAEALADLPGVVGTEGAVEDGTVVVTVTVAADRDTAEVTAVLEQFTVRARVEVQA